MVMCVILQICSGHLMAVGSRHYQRITVLRFSDDGAYLISGGDDNLAVVWSLSRCACSVV